jgi:hypothetical protein
VHKRLASTSTLFAAFLLGCNANGLTEKQVVYICQDTTAPEAIYERRGKQGFSITTPELKAIILMVPRSGPHSYELHLLIIPKAGVLPTALKVSIDARSASSHQPPATFSFKTTHPPHLRYMESDAAENEARIETWFSRFVVSPDLNPAIHPKLDICIAIELEDGPRMLHKATLCFEACAEEILIPGFFRG